VRGRGDTIVVLAPNSTIGQNQQDALDRLITDTASLSGNVVLRFADPDVDTTVASLLRLRPLAVVDLGALAQPARDRLAQQGVPTVPDIGGAAPTVHLDVSIAEMQVSELQRRTRRNVIYAGIRDGRPDPFSPQRFAAIQQVCASIELPPPIRVDIPIDPEGAFDVLAPLIREVPVGLAAYNDTVALAAASVARRLRIAIPADMSVIGVDNTPAMQLVAPSLTSIAVNMDAYIDRAVGELVRSLQLEIELPQRKAVAPLRIVRGEST
jgi:DNA-binding LacI/PurR family transcriptional regulator